MHELAVFLYRYTAETNKVSGVLYIQCPLAG